VKAGDVLGLNQAGDPGPIGTECSFAVPGESNLIREGNLADGDAAGFGSDPGYRLNISAVFVPSNSFTLGKAKPNRGRARRPSRRT
jgi:hypothetical protein